MTLNLKIVQITLEPGSEYELPVKEILSTHIWGNNNDCYDPEKHKKALLICRV